MRDPHKILLRPHITEKSLKRKDLNNQFSFWVAMDANKIEVTQALEKGFNLKNKILSVSTAIYKGKPKRLSRYSGYRSDRKKAVITLVRGVEIPIFDER
jgi:large subunit ribosomal protein L23